VAQQCKENIFAIQTLRDFQHVEESRDQGLNVREKAKHLVLLLKDEERLKNERARALKAKERFAQSQTGIGSDVVSGLARFLFVPILFIASAFLTSFKQVSF
jgi:epsin